MLDYRRMLLLKKQGASMNTIARLMGCKWDTVKRVLSRCEDEWDSLEDIPKDLSNEQIADKIFVSRFRTDEGYLQPDSEIILQRQEAGSNRNELWLEYLNKAQRLGMKAYKISRFNEIVSEYAYRNDISTLILKKPGLEGQVDWVGELASVTDMYTGEQTRLHIFVLSLPYSGYFYAEAFPNEKMESWLDGHKHAFEFFGGCPAIMIPDNCRTAMTVARKGVKDKPAIINATYAGFAEHYGFSVSPARSRRPKDKAHVERTVRIVELDFLKPMRELTLHSILEFNRVLHAKLRDRLAMAYTKRDGSRESIFKAEEQKMLLPLPALEYQSYVQKKAVVSRDSHIQFDCAYYSVPSSFIKDTVLVKATVSQVFIYSKDKILLTEHPRALRKWQRITDGNHLPKPAFSHGAYTKEEFLIKARLYGEAMVQWCEAVLDRFEFEIQGFRTLSATLAKLNTYHPDVVREAAQKALNSSVFSAKGFGILAGQLQQQRVNELAMDKIDLNDLYCSHDEGGKV